jgi:hypothetical protein
LGGVASTHADKHTHTHTIPALSRTHTRLGSPPVVGSPSAASEDSAGHFCDPDAYCEDVYGVSCLDRSGALDPFYYRAGNPLFTCHPCKSDGRCWLHGYVCCWGEACQWLYRVEFSSTACGACQPLQDRWVHDPNARCTCEERYHCESAVACSVHLGLDVACPVHGYAAVCL